MPGKKIGVKKKGNPPQFSKNPSAAPSSPAGEKPKKEKKPKAKSVPPSVGVY